MKTLKNLVLLLGLFASVSCESVIHIDLDSSTPQIVIEGNLTDQHEPYVVKISKTVGFNDASIYPPVQNAIVSIADDAGNTERLTEVLPGTYQTRDLRGIPGRTYRMIVKIDNQEYNAKCKMPALVKLDNISFIERSGLPIPGGFEKTLALIPRFVDPANVSNYYRFVQWENGKKDKAILILNDDIIDGKLNKQPLISFDFKIKLGDTVKLEMQNIDQQVYDYFSALNNNDSNRPGGSATPANPTSNISGGVLGYFSAHTVQQRTIVLK